MAITDTPDLAADAPQAPAEGETAVQLDAEPVLAWDQRALDAIQAEAPSPLLASRALAMESIAVFVVVEAIGGASAALSADPEALEAVSAAAVAAAAHRVLSGAFPAEGAALDASLAESLADVPDGAAETAAVAFGDAVADFVIALRADDGWNAVSAYEGGTEPGE